MAYDQGSAGDVGEHLLHDGVVTMLPLGLDQLERGVGEDGVVAPGREQLVLPGCGTDGRLGVDRICSSGSGTHATSGI
jgi:hypothetical protein